MTDKGKSSKSVAQQTRLRKYWIGCNWKCTGNISFIKDSIKNMFNDFEYEQNHLDLMILPGSLHLPLVQAIIKEGILIGA